MMVKEHRVTPNLKICAPKFNFFADTTSVISENPSTKKPSAYVRKAISAFDKLSTALCLLDFQLLKLQTLAAVLVRMDRMPAALCYILLRRMPPVDTIFF